VSDHDPTDSPQSPLERLFLYPGLRVATTALCVLNVLVFVLMWASGTSLVAVQASDVIAWGAVEPLRIWGGEAWRLLTACFVHLGVLHIALNVWTLWVIGRALERLIGPLQMLLVYVTSGIVGFAVSVAVDPSITAGASGAIFGVTGALLALAVIVRGAILGRVLVTALVPFVVGTLAIGWLLPFINNLAHVGGFVFGFLLTVGIQAGDRGFVTKDATVRETLNATLVSPREKQLGWMALVASLVVLVGANALALRPSFSPVYQALSSMAALSRGEETAARMHLSSAMQQGPDDALTWLARAALENNTDHARAVAFAQTSLRRFSAAAGDATFSAAASLNDASDALLQQAVVDDQRIRDEGVGSLLCEAATTLDPNPPASLANNCAWLWATAERRAVRRPNDAVRLGQIAAADGEPAFVHTYAVALAEAGSATEGVAVLEKLIVDRGAVSLGSVDVRSERARLSDMASQQRRASTTTPRMQ
jgi:membrane associated rhomboid family serine protease